MKSKVTVPCSLLPTTQNFHKMSPPHDRKLLFTTPPPPPNTTFAASKSPQPRPRHSNSTVSSPPHQQPFPSQPTPSTNQALNSSIALTILALLTALFFMSFLSLYLRRVATTASTSRHHGDDDDPYPYPYPFPHSRHMFPSPPSLINHRPRHYYTRSDIPSCSTHRKGVDPWVLDALPVFSYRGEAKYQVDCAICLGEFEEGERVKVIPCCEHVFHAECIDRWLRSNGSCPVCRDTRLTSSTVKNSLVESDQMCRP